MNENENYNENYDDTPENDNSGVNEQEETQAFNWEFTEERTPNDDNPYNESDAKGDKDQAPNATKDQAQENTNKKEKSKRSAPLLAAIILSSCAITLLLSFVLFAVTGLIPLGDGHIVYIEVSDGGTVSGEVYESDADMLEDVMNSVVIVSAQSSLGKSTGTGIVISKNGYIVTNYHVVEKSDEISVKLRGASEATPATLVGYSEVDDVAVLKILATNLTPATFAKSDSCRVGDKVYAIGTPEGELYGWSVTQGIISCPDREILIYDNEGILIKKMNVVQTDASVNQGNSGGPLVNARGEVVGIITLKLSGSAGMGFAIPSDGALKDIEAIIKSGNADNVDSGISKGRPLLGITGVGVEGGKWYQDITTDEGSMIKEVTESFARQNPNSTFYAEKNGVRVSALTEGLDAAGKLDVGDIITAIDGETVYNIYQVMDIINRHNGGDTVTVSYWRNGQTHSANITLGTQAN
jgi:serine protease Do